MTRGGLCFAFLYCSAATTGWGLSITAGSNLGTNPIGYLQIPLNASGGTGNYTWSLASGTLATGLNIAAIPGTSQPSLVGVATTPGNYSFSLTVNDTVTQVTQAFTMKITGLTVKDINLPDAFPNTAYAYTFTPLNNAGAVTFTVTSPPLPTGLNLSSGGVLSGSVAAAGTYSINFSVFDGVDTMFRGYQLQVFAVDLTSPGALPNATMGTTYSQTLTASGGAGGYTYALTGGSLPAGLALSGAGVISGTVAYAGTGIYWFYVTVTDSSHNSYQKTMTIDVLGPTIEESQINPQVFDDPVVGNNYGWQIGICCGGTAPFTWTASGLPAGMSIRWGSGVTSDYIAPGYGEIWGVPTNPGNYNVTLTVTDSLGASASLTFPLHVSVLTLGPYSLQPGTINTPYSLTFEMVGGSAPYSVVQVPQSNGFLPEGLVLNTDSEATGYFTVSGTPIENGNFDPVFKVTDGLGNTLTRNNFFTINNTAGGITINNGPNLGSFTAGAGFSIQFNACCVLNYVWSAPGGLPTGLTLSPNGLLEGSVTSAGTYTFAVKAADAAGIAAPGFRQFVLNITPLVITTNLPAYLSVQTAYNIGFTATGGTGTLTWSVPFGFYLPPGLTLAANGTLSGIPTLTGQYFFVVTVADAGGHTATRSYGIDVYPAGILPPVSFASGPNLGTVTLGADQFALGANGGNGTYTWTLVSGSLPPGLALRTDVPTFFAPNQQAGLIGVAITPGNYNFTLRVASSATTATQAFTIRVTALTLQDATPPDGFVGTAFSYAFTPINNAGAVTFSVNSNSTGGVMPPGLSLSSAGVLSGTPTTPGNYQIAMIISDGVDNLYQQYELSIYALKITNSGLLPSSGILPNATQYSNYSTTLTASGGAGGYTFTTPGGLPNGLTLSSAGVVSGAPTTGPGIYGFNVTVNDSASNSYSKHMALDVIGSPLAPMRITNLSWNDPTLGDHYGNVQSVCCGGTAPFTWTVTGLPPGMAYEPNSNSFNNYPSTPGGVQIYGVPQSVGTYNVLYTVTDAAGVTSSVTVPMHVSALDEQLPNGNCCNLPNGTINVPYSATFRVLGGSGPYTFSKTVDGELPDGLAITPSTLTVSGTPLENGNFNSPRLLFADSAGNTLSRYENISISGGTSTITINSNGYYGYNLGTTPLGAFFSAQFSACCLATYVWSVGAGSALPPGLSLSSSGQLSGTPTTPGTYTFLIDAASSTAPSNVGVKSFALTVTPISITTNSLPYGDVGAAYSASLAATGGTGTLNWTLIFLPASQLPPGLTLNTNGTITGTPASAGAFGIIVLVTDSSGHTAIQNYTINIYQSGPPPLNLPIGPSLGNFAVGPNQLMIQLQASGGAPPYHYSITPGTLPILGLRVQDGQPLPTGFPSSVTGGILALLGPGNYNTSIRVTDSTSAAFDRAINFSVLPVDVLSLGNIPRAVLNTPYSFQFTGYGGSGSYLWTGSSLPPGLTLSASGLLSGTPTSAGTFNFSVNIADAAGGASIGRAQFLTVSPFAITDTQVLPQATAGTAYNHQFSAPGCGAVCTWTAPSGGLPSGFTLTSSGLLSGAFTPAGGAEFSFYIQASGAGNTTQKYFTLIILPTVAGTLAISNTGIGTTSITQGVLNAYSLAASGGVPPYTFTLSAGTLPPGMSLEGTGETIGDLQPGFAYFAGRPMAPGSYNFTFKVADSASHTATQAYTVNVALMELLYTGLPLSGHPLVLGASYSQPMLVVGGNGNYTSWTTSAAIYPGLSVNSSTGLITGTPTSATFQSTVWTVADSAGNALANFVSISGAVAETISSINPSTAVAGETFTLTVNGTNFQSTSVPYWNTAPNIGPLPNVQFGGSTLLTATVPASYIQAAGSYPISVSTGGVLTSSLSLTVVSGTSCGYALSSPSATIPSAAGPYSVSLTTSCSYSTVSNSPWITITSGGSGTGSGTIGYSVSANTTGSQRAGSIIVLDGDGYQAAVFTITQQTPPCSSMIITSGSFTFSSAATNGAVTLSSGCPWSAVSSSTSFLTLPASTGTASSIAFNVTQNPGSQRSATITVTNTTTGSVFPAINVVQNGQVCTYSIADATSGATSNGFSSSAGSGSINVTAPAGCAWIATTPSGSFVSITGSSSGSGNGNVSYSIPTSTAARSSSITITGQVTGQSYTGQVYTITQASPATTASCVANAGVPPTVRAEGVTERGGDIVITCATGSAPAPGILGDVTVYFSSNGVNVAPTNQLIGSGSYTDALLLINEPTAPVLNTNAFRGEVTPVPALAGRPAGYVMLFPAVQLTPTAGGSFSNLTFRITNMRLNVSAPGVSTSITATVSMPPPFASGSFTTQTVASIQQGLPNENTPTSLGLASQTAANFTVNFAEGFANDFHPRLATGQNPSAPGTVYNAESGFVNSAALGTQTGFATTGTRLLATFTGVPAGVTIYAPVAPLSGSNAGLVAADSTGNGGTFVPGSLINGVLSQAVSIAGGAGAATWEVTDSNPAVIETFGFSVYISNPGGANLSNMKYAISFAPAIGLGGTSATAPIPRFPTAGTQPALGSLSLAPTAGSLAGSLLAISHLGNAAAIQKALALSASSTIGGSVTVSELVANASSNPASNVVVGGSLPTSWTVAGCYAPDANGSCTMSGNQFTVNYPTLSPGQTGTIIFTGQTPLTGLSTLSFNSIVSSDASNGSSLGSFTVSFPVPAFTIQKTHASNFTQGQTGAQYSISVVNSATTSTSGQVTVTDTLPTGLTLTGMSDGGAGVWACTVGTATCTTSQSLAPTLGYPPITVTVNVAATAPANVINTATVSGGGSQGPATALDSTNIGPSCSYQLNAASAGAGAGAGTGSVNVTALYGCQWTATSNASWLTVTSGSPGNGNGTVNYLVLANPGPGGRSGTLTIGGQAFTVNQTAPGPVTMTLSQTTLNFAAAGGVITGPQMSTVSFSGSARVAWTASSSQPNVTVSPASGTGLGTLTITASAGPSATITVTAPGASNSPLTIQANVATVTPAVPFGSFDTPPSGATGLSGSIAVTGWALDSIGIAASTPSCPASGVDIWREPVAGEPASPSLIFLGCSTFVIGARPDVQALYPTTPFNYQAGWGYLMLSNELPNNGSPAGIGNGTYKIHAIAHNKSGTSLDLGTKTITINNAAATLPFGAIDTPGQGATVSGTVTNFGWALTPPATGCPAADQPCIIPVNGSTIFVYVDGVSLGNPVYNLARSDVDTLFPGYANSGSLSTPDGGSPGPVGYFNLDTTQFTNGVHTIAWSVTDNAGKAQGIGSRYFTVEN